MKMLSFFMALYSVMLISYVPQTTASGSTNDFCMTWEHSQGRRNIEDENGDIVDSMHEGSCLTCAEG